MRILFLTDNFPPEGNAPATRTFEHAIRWVKKGHEVTVITGAPNFPEGVVFEGYSNRWYQREYIDGIEVVRVKTYISANKGFIKRILDYLSFMVSGFVAGLFRRKFDIVVGTSPQLFTAVASWALSRIRRRPFIFELRDIWPASITAVGAMKQSLVIRVLERLELFLYRSADRIVSVTESFKQELISRGIDGSKIDVVLNGVDLDRYKPTTQKDSCLAKKYNLEGKFVVGYIGTHGMAHGLEFVMEAAKKLQFHDDISFIFAGGGAAREALEMSVKEGQLSNVVLIPRQPKELMPNLWSLCDVSLVCLRNQKLFSTVIPSKIFESMGMGIPMVLSVPEGEATQLVRESGAGIIVQPESPDQLSEAILSLHGSEPLRGNLAYQSALSANEFSRETMAEKMLELIEKESRSCSKVREEPVV